MSARRTGWALLIGSLLIVSALVLTAGGALSLVAPSNGHTASSAPSHAGPPGPSEGPYVVTFQESGLPSGVCWSVALSNGLSGALCPSSDAVMISFSVSNGTYHYTISNATAGWSWNASGVYAPTPSTGSVTVAGANVTVDVTFAKEATYAVTFSETGLPNGTFWWVELGGGWDPASGTASPAWFGGNFNGSNGSTVGFTVPDGTYSFAIGNVSVGDWGDWGNNSSVLVPVPATGSVTVDGANVSLDVTFSTVSFYNVTFLETGLPNGTGWTVSVFGPSSGGSWNYSTNSSLSFELPNGTYQFSVGNTSNGSALYLPTPMNGTFTVAGANVTVDVAFTAVPLYNLSFVETGLPNGSFWFVELWGNATGGEFNGSSNSTVSFLVPDGAYNFTISNGSNGWWACGGGSSGWAPSPAYGTVTVDGASVTVQITFSQPSLYSLSFAETGLPNGTWWSVAAFNGSTGWFANGTNNSSIAFAVPNGTYEFYVANISNGSSVYVPSPAVGNVTVNGSAVAVTIDFASVALYNVSFLESGLPNGTFWAVVLHGPSAGWGWNGSSNSTLGFLLPNGTYNFTVLNASPGECVHASGVYAPTPSTGSVTVAGANVTVDVTFAKEATYAVTFSETGLPNGTFWWVELGVGWDPASGTASPAWFGGNFNGSNGSTVGFTVPDGTYSFVVGLAGNPCNNSTVYAPTPENGTVTVNGTDVTVRVTFAPASNATNETAAGGAASLSHPARPTSGDLPEVGLAIIALGTLAALGALMVGRSRP